VQADQAPDRPDQRTPRLCALFDTLHAEHARGIRAHLLSMVRDVDAADDLAQETFLRAWAGLPSLKSPAAARSWLYRIATNCALNYVRGRKLRRHVPLEPVSSADEDDEEAQSVPVWMIDGSGRSPAEELAAREAAAALEGAIEGLSPDKQRVVRLIQEQRMSMREAARALGIPEGTVKSRLHYALRQIEGKLKEMEES
jgi:RNA polymerase sigma-70 factor (ECF subfamily)